MIEKNFQFYKFCAYGFLKNLRLFDPFILIYLRSVDITFFQIGVLYSVREISTIIMEIPTGIIADLMGRKKSLLLSFTAYIISFLLFYFYSFFIPLMFAMFFFALGDAFRTGTHKAMILDYLKSRGQSDLKTEYYGRTRSWSQKGSALSSLIGGGLILIDNNFSIIFLVSVIPYLLNFFNILSYPNLLDGPIKKKNKKVSFKDILSIIKNRDYRIRVINSASFDGLFKTIKDYLQPILASIAVLIPTVYEFSDTQKSTIIISIVYFLIFSLNAVASKNSAKVSTAFKNLAKAINRTLLIGCIIVVICGLTFELDIPFLTMIMFIAVYIMQNIRRPLNISFISETIPTEFLASGLSVESQTRTLFVAIFSPIVGYLADYLGIGWAIATIAVIALIFYPLIKIEYKS